MTSTPSSATYRIDAYVAAVSARLTGLLEDERNEMLDDLRENITELMHDQPDATVESLLGTPAAYADELLQSAGVQDRAGARLDQQFFAEQFKAVLPSLQAAWWVIRAYLAVGVVLAIPTYIVGFGLTLPVPESFGVLLLVMILTVVLVPFSVALGRKQWGQTGQILSTSGNILLGLVAVLLIGLGVRDQTHYIYQDASSSLPTNEFGGTCLVDSGSNPITNLYAYDTNGNLLPQVLLFDQSGRAIDNLCPDSNNVGDTFRTEYAKDANGASVYNAFPRVQWKTNQYDDNGMEKPDSLVTPPAIITPRLAPVAPEPTTTTTVDPAVTTTVPPTADTTPPATETTITVVPG